MAFGAHYTLSRLIRSEVHARARAIAVEASAERARLGALSQHLSHSGSDLLSGAALPGTSTATISGS